MEAKLLSVDAFDLDQHEVATVEGIDLPALGITRLICNLVDMLRPDTQRLAFRIALGGKTWRHERTLDQCLRQLRHVGDTSTNCTTNLCIEYFADDLGSFRSTRSEGHEPATQPPDEEFLGRPVEFHGEQIRMSAGEFSEERFGHRLGAQVVEKTEIGVVAENDQLGSTFSLALERGR